MPHTKFYDILEVSTDANREQIATAYRKLALQHHPIRNASGNVAAASYKFSQVSEAYEVLSDPLMKRIFDKHGEQSLRDGVQKGPDKFLGYQNQGNPHAVFEAFFGSDNPYVEEPAKCSDDLNELEQIALAHRDEDVIVEVECSLHEFYNGALKEVHYQRKQLFLGSSERKVITESITVQVKPGYSEESQLRMPGKGNEAQGAHPSDLVIKFKQTPVANYVRKGDDLIYTHKLALVDALQPTPITVTTLDSRSVFVTPGEIVTPQTRLEVAGEGMPRGKTGDLVFDTQTQMLPVNSQEKGSLFVRFDIEFPKRILTHHKNTILHALAHNN